MSPRRRLVALSLAITPTLLPAPAAYSQTWDGGGADARWSTVNNWQNNLLPSTTAAITIGTGFNSGPTIFLNGNRTADSLVINTTTDFQLGDFLDPGVLTLTSGVITRQDVAGTELNQTIMAPVVLPAN